MSKAPLLHILFNILLKLESLQADRDIQDAIAGITSKVHIPGCVVAFVYDDLMSQSEGLDDFINALQSQSADRIHLIYNLTSKGFSTQNDARTVSARMAHCLHILYRLAPCYTFIFWIKNPAILYPADVHIHPGWRYEDVVIFASHHISQRHRALTHLRFWREIPNIIGVKRPPYYGNQNELSIFTVLPYSNENSIPRTKELDAWLISEKKFKNDRPRESFIWNKFSSFNNSPLRIGMIWKAPFLIWGNEKHPYLDGIDWRLLLLIQKKMQFRYDLDLIIQAPTTGSKYNGTWTGGMGYLQFGQADIFVGGVSAAPNRLSDFDFCHTYHTDSYVFISPIKTVTNVDVLRELTKPLTPVVWLALVMTSFLVIILLKVMANIEASSVYRSRKNYSKFKDLWYSRLGNGTCYIFNTFCQNPIPHVPNSNVLRFIFIGTSLSITILGKIFSAFLFSELLKGRGDISLNLLSEAASSKLDVYVMNYDGMLNHGAKFSKRKGYKKLWDRAKFVDYFETLDCIDSVVNGQAIYIDSNAKLNFIGRYHYMGAHGIKFHFGKEKLVSQVNVGWPTRNRWPFQLRINSILSRAIESGLVAHWMSMFHRGKFGTDDESLDIRTIPNSTFTPMRKNQTNKDPTLALQVGTEFTPIGATQFSTVAGIWWLGILLSFVTFVGEIVWHGTWTIAKLFRKLFLFIIKNLKDRFQNDEVIELNQIRKSLESPKRTKWCRKKQKKKLRWTDLSTVP